jgi:TRAP-type uncharacterized transport system substrate-binding protein
MSLQSKLVKVVWKGVAPIASVAALGPAVCLDFHSRAPRTYLLRMTAGNAVGMRHQLALRLQGEVIRRNLVFELVPSAGSKQALAWVNRREVDIALVQGGLTSAGRPNVREVAALHVEPMHLLVKNELSREASTSLTALRGKSVDVSETGSGTHSLATASMEFVGLRPPDQDPAGGYRVISLDRKQLFAEEVTARLPDAVFQMSSLPSPIANYLVTRHGYRLVPLPFVEVFAGSGAGFLARRPAAAADQGAATGHGGTALRHEKPDALLIDPR